MKTFQEFQEEWITDLQNNGFGVSFKVYENPTAKDLSEILKDSFGSKDVRVLVDTKTGKVFAFNSLLIHETVIKYLKLDKKTTYKGIGLIRNGKIFLGFNREIDKVLFNNPKYDYSKLYYDEPYKAFQVMKKNCVYMYHPIFHEESIDRLLQRELKQEY
jgi:hypothetical protein